MLINNIKAALVRLTLWGLLPIPVTEWLIRFIDQSSTGGASS
jgi:hypothetical protein